MNIMKQRLQRILICVCVAFFGSLNIAVANEQLTELNAKIMEIDLENNLLIVGEQYVRLQVSMDNFQKRWITLFNNQNGEFINPRSLKATDRVIVKGETQKSGEILANEVMFIEKTESSSPRKKVPSSKQNTGDIHKDNGVWVN